MAGSAALPVASVLAIGTASLVVVIAGVVLVVGLLVLWLVQGFPDKHPAPAGHRDDVGPTGTPYPPGSRPAGPDAEGMRVPEPGEVGADPGNGPSSGGSIPA